jgi:hypothetical protein
MLWLDSRTGIIAVSDVASGKTTSRGIVADSVGIPVTSVDVDDRTVSGHNAVAEIRGAGIYETGNGVAEHVDNVGVGTDESGVDVNDADGVKADFFMMDEFNGKMPELSKALTMFVLVNDDL